MTQMMGAEVQADAIAPVWLKRYPADVDWRQAFPPAPLTSLMDHAVATYGNRPGQDHDL